MVKGSKQTVGFPPWPVFSYNQLRKNSSISAQALAMNPSGRAVLSLSQNAGVTVLLLYLCTPAVFSAVTTGYT